MFFPLNINKSFSYAYTKSIIVMPVCLTMQYVSKSLMGFLDLYSAHVASKPSENTTLTICAFNIEECTHDH